MFAALPSDVRRIGDAYQTATGDVYQLRPHAWQVVGVFSLRGAEPDWQVVECGRNFERCPLLCTTFFGEPVATSRPIISAKDCCRRVAGVGRTRPSDQCARLAQCLNKCLADAFRERF